MSTVSDLREEREELWWSLSLSLLDDEEWEQCQTIMRNDDLDLEAKMDELYNIFDDGFPSLLNHKLHDLYSFLAAI